MSVHAAHIPLATYGGAIGATLLWRRSGQLCLTTILKARLSLVSDEVAVLSSGAAIAPFDRMDAGGRTLEVASDLVPSLPVAEIILCGHACSPADRAVTSLSVRLFVGREDQPLLDKTLHVYGDRATPTAYPLPFQRVPVVYERAVGGPTTDNPVGRPLHDASVPPNVVNPLDPWVVAGFAAIASSWPARQRLARGQPVLQAGVLDIPEHLSLEYFHAAPKDQRVPPIAGNEWIVIDGMHPELARFQSQLPGLRARARIAPRADVSADATSIEMVIARMWIDMDHRVVDVTWRGTVSLSQSAIGSLQVVAGLEPATSGAMGVSNEMTAFDEPGTGQAAHEQSTPWSSRETVPPASRRPSYGQQRDGLPFGAPRDAGAAPPDRSDAPPAAHDAMRVTITPNDHATFSALPFARGPSAALQPPQPPQTVKAPNLHDDDSEDSAGGLTSVAPRPEFSVSTGLPFDARRQPPARTPAQPADSPLQLCAPDASSAAATAPSRFGPSAVTGVQPAASALPFSRPQRSPAESVAKLSPAPPALFTLAGAPNPLGLEHVTEDLPALQDPASLPSSPPLDPPPTSTAVVSAPVKAPVSAAPTAAAAPAQPQETGIRRIVLDKVKAREAMHGMDLSSVDLSGMDLSGAVLGDAKLNGAKLVRTQLKGARLSGARLVGADLRGADLTEADLCRADLTRAILTDAVLDRADLGDANASLLQAAGASLRSVRAERASFVQAQLENVVFEGAALRDADFSGASLAGASFRSAHMTGARFVDARASGASFDAAQLDGAIFTGASLTDVTFTAIDGGRTNWERAELDRSSFDRAKLRDATFARASLGVVSFLGADLGKADLSNISAEGADFSEATLVGADLRMSKLSDARFENANLREVNAQKLVGNGARLEGADLSRASLRGARLKACDLARTKLDGTDLRDADLEGAKFAGVDVSKAKLAGANLKGAEGL